MKVKTLGRLQEKIIEILWRAGRPLKPAEVLEELGDNHAYTTIMTILKRMKEKKLLKRKLRGRVYFYSPAASREKWIESNLRDTYNDLVDSYGRVAIANFVDVIKNNKDDMAILKEYLES